MTGPSIISSYKKQMSIMLICFGNLLAAAQSGLDNYWLFGYNCCSTNFGVNKMDFKTGNINFQPVLKNINFKGQHAVISDSMGTLLFYTNGIFIYDANDSLMQNSDTLGMNSCTLGYIPVGGGIPQGSIIIPKPNSPKNYYLLNESCDYTNPAPYPKKLAVTEVDMNLHNGLGAVIYQDSVLSNLVLTWGGLTAVKHGNGSDWWVVTHSSIGNSFYTYLVTPQGIQGPFTQQIGFTLALPNSGAGQTWFSPDGSKLVTTSNTDINLFDFDRCTGLFSNWTLLAKPDTSPFTGGCAFSPMGKYLYYSEAYHLYQYDVSVTNWQSTETLVATYDGFVGTCNTLFLYWTLMSNGKIYGVPAGCGEQYLHVINLPDSAGTACNLQQHSVYLPTHNAVTSPNYPNYRLGKLVGSVCDTITGIAPVPNALPFWVRVFPNPANDIVNFTYTSGLFEQGTICITDNLSRIVFTQKINGEGSVTINLRGLNSGLYTYHLSGDSFSSFGKLILIKK
jgi:hypothetical protein